MDGTPSGNESAAPPRSSLPIVGLGASAGGIRALKEFFACVPAANGIAWVVILHLSPDHDSKLAEVLQVTAPMLVTQVTDRVEIERDHVYVVPPNKSLEIAGNTLLLSEVTRSEQRRSAVDVFFRALALAHGPQAACVVLSGTGPNGSVGVKHIKEHGGLAIAQDPAEAEYSDMPRNAIATGFIDVVLPIAQIPGTIIDYFERIRRIAGATGGPSATDEEVLGEVLRLLRARTGHDFSNYKIATLQRRIARRVHLRGVKDVAEYAGLLRQQPEEATALMQELLISVTNFFRDPLAWTVLEQRIVPRLFFNKGRQDQVRAWVAGCATGEEAYSLAMLLADYAASSAEAPSIQVFATDLDEHAIAVARQGFYTEAEVADLSEERLLRFFQKDTGGYRVKRELRELLLFAHHNLIKDPPFSHLDLISCRNLLIYLNRSIQERVIETLHFALRPGGYLFLGTSESPDGTLDLFSRVDAHASLYESRSVVSRLAPPVVERPLFVPHLSAKAPEPRAIDRILPADLHQRVLEQYAPPSLVVTEDYDVVHVSERAGRYLQVPGGEPTRELLRLVRPELRADLVTALHQAARERRRVDVGAVAVALDDGPRPVDLVVRPVLREGDPARGYFVILFQEGDVLEEASREAVATLESPGEPARHLEGEVARLKAELRVRMEQYETQAEDAKAGTEELQAMNEELRSAAEELETGKEELQSVNEELTTVNQELKIKIEELGLKNDDFQNLINSTDIGTIFLDRALQVKLFTPRAQDVFNLLDADVGRPLFDITTRLRSGRIHEDVRSVLDRLQTVEREMETQDGRWHLMRILPYRTTDNRIDGVVLTFQDITDRRRAETQVRTSEERLRLLIEGAVDYAIFTLTEDAHIDSWNGGAERLYGYTSDEILGSAVEVLYAPADREAGVPATELETTRRRGRSAEERYHVRRDGTPFFMSGVTIRLGDGSLGFARIARDLTRHREAADALRHAQTDVDQLVHRRTSELVNEKQTVTDLIRRLVTAQEDERARIARDLHDSMGQELTALQLALERHHEACSTPGSGDSLAEALSITQRLGRDIDFLAWELRPSELDDLGLAVALPRFVETWSAHVGIQAECRLNGFDGSHLAPQVEVAFYRIVQEALNNVAKHAHATRADVVLSISNGDAVLVVEDDGAGFDTTDPAVKSSGLGLTSMRERASLVGATLDIDSSPGKGTAVFLRAPVGTPPPEARA